MRRCIRHAPSLTRWALSIFLALSTGISRAETTSLVPAFEERSAGGASAPRVEAMLDRLPLAFEANTGKFDRRVKFLARGHGQKVFVTSDGMVLALGSDAWVALEFQGRNTEAKSEGVEKLDGITNYFIGDESSPFNSKYFTNIPNFARVRQQQIYPGIDVVYYGSRRQLEYDLIIAPGADAGRIKVRIKGHDKASISESGDLVLTTRAGEVRLKKPLAYQERDGGRVAVPARYVLEEDRVRFDVAAYDTSRALIIDPLLSYSTIVGGSGGVASDVYGVAVNAAGNAYVAGNTTSTNFPLVNAFETHTTGSAAFVSKLNASGTGFIYSTFISGAKSSSSNNGVAIDSSGNAYVFGRTDSNFPVTKGAYQTRNTGNAAFVAKLGPQGNTLIYATFINGLIPSGVVFSHSIAVDASGNAYVSGSGVSNFVPTTGAFQSTIRGGTWDAAVVKLNATGTAAVYATFLGGTGNEQSTAIAVDGAGNAYVTGYTTSSDFPTLNAYQPALRGTQDAFVTKFSSTGALVYSTYLGGSDSAFGGETGESIAVDSSGQAYVAGSTPSNDFPVIRAFMPVRPAAGMSAFVTKLAASGSALSYSTFLGAPDDGSDGFPDMGIGGIALDGAGNAYIAGSTNRVVFWPNVDAFMTSSSSVSSHPFVAKIQELDSSMLTFSTLFGAPGNFASGTSQIANNVAVDLNANIYVVGSANESSITTAQRPFPTTPGALRTGGGGFVFKITPGRFTTKLLSSNPNPTSAGAVTLSAFVTNVAPGGTVTFNSDGNPLATVPVSGGGATLTVTLPAGVHQLDAVYSGDGRTSRPLFLPVKQAAVCN